MQSRANELRFYYSSVCKHVNHLIQDEQIFLILSENGYLRDVKYSLLPVAPSKHEFNSKLKREHTTLVFAGSFNTCMGVDNY